MAIGIFSNFSRWSKIFGYGRKLWPTVQHCTIINDYLVTQKF